MHFDARWLEAAQQMIAVGFQVGLIEPPPTVDQPAVVVIDLRHHVFLLGMRW
ncbi:hypothetical protein HC928_09130 [bacterium]|nr:hypothetical protein [bacterium]